MCSTTAQRLRAYQNLRTSIIFKDSGLKVKRNFDLEELINNFHGLIEKIDKNSETSIPNSFHSFINFLNDNFVSISNGDENKLSEFKDLMIELFEDIKKDLDESIWDLIDEGVEVESLEYIHSVITDSLIIQINFLKETSVEELNKEENIEVLQKANEAYITALKKVSILLDSGSMSDDEKKSLNDIQRKLEDTCLDYLETSDDFEPIEGARI